MQRRVVVVSAVAAVLGLAAAALGFAGEAFNRKALVGSDGFRCEYRRTPALACGILAALLSLTGLVLVTAASGCFGRGRNGPVLLPVAAVTWRDFCIRICAILAWLLVVEATVMFLYGASRNAGGTGGLTYRRSRGWRNGGSRDFDFVCSELKPGVFEIASVSAAIGAACAIAAYVEVQRRNDASYAQGVSGGVAMGQPQWSAQPYPPPPVAYPAPPPYRDNKLPAGTA